MSFNPYTGRLSTLCPHCGRWNDWTRIFGRSCDHKAKGQWEHPRICFDCQRELHTPDDPVRRHYLAAHDEKQKKFFRGKK